MITIIADLHGYEAAPAGALIATSSADYVQVRRSIRLALDHTETLTVYARDPVVLGWLSDLQRYPESHITWRVVDPREAFRQLFGRAPSVPFTPARIVALRLATLSRPPDGTRVNPLSWILGQHLDPLWQYDAPPDGHAAALAAWALANPAPLDLDLMALAQAQLAQWAAQNQIFQHFHAASLAADSTQLLVRWALRHYASTWRQAQPWGALPLLDGEPSALALLSALRGQSEAIWAYWSRVIADQAADPACISTALAQMTGLSEAELAALDALVRRQPDQLDARLMTAIARRFAALPEAEATLRNLHLLVVPPQPALPDPAWPTARWLSWATQEYLPFYRWVIRTGYGREHQQACALRYSDWLYANYQTLLNDDQSPLLLGQYQDVTALIEREPQAVALWLIVDGMTWWQGALMREACARYGLHPKGLRPGVAILPSITSISKRALVTGQPTIDLTQPTIAAAARLKLARSNIPSLVSYRFSEALTALREQPHLQVVVVLFNLLDALAHQTAAFTDDAGIRGHLEELARSLGEARQICAQQGRPLHVFIGSDHGGTLLPDDAPSVALPHMVREIADVWEPELPGQEPRKPGTRAAASDLDQMPIIDGEVWYALDRERFQLDRHYLVPRGYGYIKRRPAGWTHGGLSPEETIVPLLHMSAEPLRVLPLELELRGSLRVGQAGTLTCLLRNLNPFPITEIQLVISGGVSEARLEQLGPSATYELELAVAPIHASGATLPVTYEVRYEIFGNPQHDEGQLSLQLRRLQSEDTAFDDMFN